VSLSHISLSLQTKSLGYGYEKNTGLGFVTRNSFLQGSSRAKRKRRKNKKKTPHTSEEEEEQEEE
jgi:hypothetical protein